MNKIAQHPKYKELVRSRNRVGWTLTIIMMVVYYGFIYLVAYEKEFMARPLSSGTTSLSVTIGIGVILMTVSLTGLYVFIANRKFDFLIRSIQKDVGN